MGCACALLGRDDTVEDEEARYRHGVNDVCPRCSEGFNSGDRILMDNNDIVYHYDCFEGPRPLFREGVFE